MRYADRFRTGHVRSADGTVIAYRAIGSGPPSIDRECEDVAALQAATGATLVFGHSFGGLLPTAIREHLAAARLDGPDTRYESMTANVMFLTGAKRRGPDDGALARVASSTPGAALVTLPGLDHFGPEKKPRVVAHAVSAFLPDHV